MRAGLRAVLVFALGLAPWPGSQRVVRSSFIALVNPMLGMWHCRTKLGGGRASLAAATKPSAEGPSWDTRLALHVRNASASEDVYVNPRRQFQLPLVVLLAVIAAAPLSQGARLRCLGLGLPALVFEASTTLWIMALWLFARTPGLLVGFTRGQLLAVEMGYRAFVVPQSHRYVVPLLLAGLLVAWQSRRKPQRARVASLRP